MSEEVDNRVAVIVGMSVAGAVLLVAAVSLLVVLVCRVCRRRPQTDDEHVSCTDVTQHTGRRSLSLSGSLCLSVCVSLSSSNNCRINLAVCHHADQVITVQHCHCSLPEPDS